MRGHRVQDSPLGRTLSRPWATAAAGSAVFAVVVAWQIAVRSPLSMDELHTALLARAVADGDPLSFYVGSVSRYEGGSWLIAFPVAALTWAGVWATAATSWTAAAISIATVYLASLWLAREVRPAAGLGVGPVVAFAAPELVHYSYRAWGSLSEALLFLPVLALAWSAWIDRGRRLRTAPLLGGLLGCAVVFCYLHMLTALVFVAIQGMEAARERRWRRRAAETAIVGAAALLVFATWLTLAVPFVEEALGVRDGHSLPSVGARMLLVRLDLVLWHLPHAWMGAVPDVTTPRIVAGAAMGALTVAAAVAVWRRGGRARWVVVFLVASIPAVSVGLSLAPVPMAIRYYLPLLAASAVVIAAWDLRAVGLAMAIGLTFWLPRGLEMPAHWPWRSYAELGANALHRYAPDPHVKFRAFRRTAPTELRPYLAFGYGLDTGVRFGPSWSGLQTVPFSPPERDGHFYLHDAGAWIDAWEPGGDEPDRASFFRGVGAGLALDGLVDEAEAELLAVASARDRSRILEGIGARLVLLVEAGQPPGDLAGSLLAALSAEDWQAVGRGMAAGRVADQLPTGSDLGLEPDTAAGTSLWTGQQAPRDPRLGSLLSLPIVATPNPTSNGQ